MTTGARTKSGTRGDPPRGSHRHTRGRSVPGPEPNQAPGMTPGGCLRFWKGATGHPGEARTESDSPGLASPFPHIHRPMFGPIFVKSDGWPNTGLQVALFFGDRFFSAKRLGYRLESRGLPARVRGSCDHSGVLGWGSPQRVRSRLLLCASIFKNYECTYD